MNKIPLLLGIICFVVYRLLFYWTENIWLALSIFLIPIGMLSVNFVLRKRLSYSKWFLNPMNFFLERTIHLSKSEINAELLYAKLQEVIDDSEFILLDSDNQEFKFLLGTSVNFWTWGENIYIQLESSSHESIIRFTSVTIFGNTSWKRNASNFQSFIHQFESSLTI